MGIAGFYKKTVNTQRMSIVAGSKRQSLNANLSNILVAIHPINPALVAIAGSAFYNQFKMYCATTHDIEIGDRIIDGGETYTVDGKSLYDDVGGASNEHMMCTLVKGK